MDFHNIFRGVTILIATWISYSELVKGNRDGAFWWLGLLAIAVFA